MWAEFWIVFKCPWALTRGTMVRVCVELYNPSSCSHQKAMQSPIVSTTYKHLLKVLSEVLSAVALPGRAPVNPICLQMVLASVDPSSALVSNPLQVPWLAKYRPTMPNDTLSLMLGSLVALSVGQSASLPLYGCSGLLKSVKGRFGWSASTLPPNSLFINAVDPIQS